MASPPGLAFKISRVWMCMCVGMTNFVQIRKKTVSVEMSERAE